MRLLVSALEHSSNVHLKYLLCELGKLESIELCGIFDEKILKDCQNCTGRALYNIDSFGIMGFVDVFKKLQFFLNANAKMAALAQSCDKILLMDSSSFNIPLAKRIKKQCENKEIMYYILPQVWAWKPWRAKIIERYCDKLAAILPFELKMYEKKARFVGHPLLDEICEFKQKINNAKKIITFMPGSRKAEIERIFPIFVETKNALKNMGDFVFYLIIPQRFSQKNLSEIYGDLSDFNISFNAHEVLKDSDFAFICSGTASLECAIIGTPFVLAYRAKWLDYFIAKNLIKIKYIGLANILYSEIAPNARFHTELIQNDLSVENLLASFEAAKKGDFLFKSCALRKYLQNGSAKNVASWLISNF